jgi:hypothetical protein
MNNYYGYYGKKETVKKEPVVKKAAKEPVVKKAAKKNK